MNPEPALPPFTLGLNPYGLAYTVGLQALGTARANPQSIGLEGFIKIARKYGARCIELDHRWLTPLTADALARLRDSLHGMIPVCTFWLHQQPGETLADGVRCATALGAPILRLHLTPVLEGARAHLGPQWDEMVAHARATVRRESPRVADAGVILAIENHQDLGSTELVEIAEAAGEHVGVCFDTGNPFAVGEDPIAFARRAAHRIRHVHLKDYVAQFTNEGFRLVRCAIGDGAVPFADIAALLSRYPPLTASLEPGALDVRHIRLLTPEWWDGYPVRDPGEIETLVGRLRARALAAGADYRTPWECGAAGSEIVSFEMEQMARSVENVRAMGWL